MKYGDLLFAGFVVFILGIAGFNIYIYIDGTLVYVEIRDGILPVDPYDKIDHIEMFDQASDGWYIANVFVVDSETNNFSNSMIRYNRDTKVFVIPARDARFDVCIEVKQ